MDMLRTWTCVIIKIPVCVCTKSCVTSVSPVCVAHGQTRVKTAVLPDTTATRWVYIGFMLFSMLFFWWTVGFFICFLKVSYKHKPFIDHLLFSWTQEWNHSEGKEETEGRPWRDTVSSRDISCFEYPWNGGIHHLTFWGCRDGYILGHNRGKQ